MPEIKDPKITNAETERVLLTEVKEDPLDSIEAKYRERLYFFRYIARYVILFLATAAAFVFGFRYLHLINGYEKMTDLYLANKPKKKSKVELHVPDHVLESSYADSCGDI